MMIYSQRVQLYACGKIAMLKPSSRTCSVVRLSSSRLKHSYFTTRVQLHVPTVYHHYVLRKSLSFTKILIKLRPLSIDRASLI